MHTSIAIACTQLKGFYYCYLMLIILFNSNLVCRQWSGHRFYSLTLIILLQHYSFNYTQSNGSKYCLVISIIQSRYTVKGFKFCYLTLIILLNNTHLFAQLNYSKYCYVSLIIELNISHLFTQLNDLRIIFLTIQLSTSHFFAQSLNVKHFYLTHRQDPIRSYHSGSECTWEQWQRKGTPLSLKHQHCWSLTIRMFNVISRTLVGGSLTPLLRCSRCILLPQPTGLKCIQG